jgi:arginase
MTVASVPFALGERLDRMAAPGPHETIAPTLPTGTPLERMAALFRSVADFVATHDDPVVFAGDCMASIGILAGLERRGVLPTISWFDAHGDFNTPETSPSGFLGGMPLAMITGRGSRRLPEAVGLTPVPDERVFLIGARDLDPGEAEALHGSGVRRLAVGEVAQGVPPDGPIFIHLDVDVVDPAEMPAVDYPSGGGPGVAVTLAAMTRLAATGRVVAVSVAAPNPDLPGAAVADAATRRLVAPFLADA